MTCSSGYHGRSAVRRYLFVYSSERPWWCYWSVLPVCQDHVTGERPWVLLERRASLRATCPPQQVFHLASAKERALTRIEHMCRNASHPQAGGTHSRSVGSAKGPRRMYAKYSAERLLWVMVTCVSTSIDAIACELTPPNARATAQCLTIRFIKPLSTSSVIAANS